MMTECDTLLMVGSALPYSEFLPEEGQARGIQIDVDPRLMSIRYPMEVNLVGDSAETLRQLLPLLEPKTDRSWRDAIENDVSEWWKTLESRSMNEARAINPQRVFWELSCRLPDRCIVTCDSGTAATWYVRDLKFRSGMMGSLSGGLASMGSGVPCAIAAKFAHPDRPVIAVVGDGAMQMNGMNELITAAKYCRRWTNPTLVIMVLDNLDLNMVTWEQRALAGDPKFPASQDVPQFSYAAYADLIGLEGIAVTEPAGVGPAWDRALSANRPVVLDVHTDPDVPPLPPHFNLKQVREYTSALLKRDADAMAIVKASLKEIFA